MNKTIYKTIWLRLLAATLAVGSLGTIQAAEQAYPSKPIRILVGFAPGGTTDILAREVAARLQESWGRPVLVDNRAGAGGNIASELGAKAAPDGYTLVLTTNSVAINASLYVKPGFDAINDYAPILFMGSVTNVFFSHPSLPARNVKELTAFARSRPGQVTFGSGGVGTSPHLAVELYKALAKVDLTHVPYKGVPPVVTSVLSGEIAMGTASLPSAGLPDLINAGRLRGLALTGAKRSKAVPQVPTMEESGFPGYDVPIWYGMLAPAGTPPDIVGRLNKEFIRIMNMPVVRERMQAYDFDIKTSTPAEFAAYIKSEIGQWDKVIKQAGVPRQ